MYMDMDIYVYFCTWIVSVLGLTFEILLLGVSVLGPTFEILVFLTSIVSVLGLTLRFCF
jgi:hypothetical protein